VKSLMSAVSECADDRGGSGTGFPSDEMRLFSSETQSNASSTLPASRSSTLCWFWCGKVQTGSSTAEPYYGTLAQQPQKQNQGSAMNESNTSQYGGEEREEAQQHETSDDFLSQYGNGYRKCISFCLDVLASVCVRVVTLLIGMHVLV
jgi:hypothetical protein